MTDYARSNALVSYAIRTSCIPLLCGTPKRVRHTARLLHRAFGLVSYAIYDDNRRNLRLLQQPVDLWRRHYLRTLPCEVTSPAFLADAAVRFFSGTDNGTIPVLIDCTDERLLISDGAICAALESRCFVTTPEHYTEIPPFCYLTGQTNDD